MFKIDVIRSVMNSRFNPAPLSTPHCPIRRYKALVRLEIQRHRERAGTAFTQSALALRLGIEGSYLSRCLNHSSCSPSRELLFRILLAVDTPIFRIQELLDLYDISQAAHADYRHYLEVRERVTETRRTVELLLEIEPRVRRISYSLERISQAAAEWGCASNAREKDLRN